MDKSSRINEPDFGSTIPEDGHPILARRYRVLRKLGEGGMGEVHLAEDQKLDNKRFAIKMPPSILARNARAMETLKKEALRAMELSHPHIVTVRSFEQSDDGVFIIMDFIEGETLEELLRRKGTLSEEELLRIFTPIAGALDHAHLKKVIHRDVKPSNIMIANDGTPYIMDFGIAREAKETFTRFTGKETTSGTLPYMSPEQVRGKNPKPTQDVYSLAATMYECLAGHPPFHRGDLHYQIIHESPEPPPSDSPDKSGVDSSPLVNLIMQGLSKDADERPRSCTELLNLTSHPSTARNKVVVSSVTSSESPTVQPPTGECKHGASFTNTIGMEFVLINPKEVAPEGFLMGSPRSEQGRYSDEQQHRVILTKPYWLGVTPVTQSQYRAVIGENPSYFKKKEGGFLGFGGTAYDLDDHPVESVSWNEALDFTLRIGEQESKKYRLPSEAEWELACRAGSTSRFSFGDSDSDLGEYAWHYNNSSSKTHTVGGKNPNDWDLYDMHGNVWEWCEDWYDENYYKNTPEQDPTGPSSGSYRVLRGASWLNFPVNCRSARRDGDSPVNTYGDLGFRVCLDFK